MTSKTQDCQTTTSLGTFNEDVRCNFVLCSWKGSDLQAHHLTCRFRRSKCFYCDAVIEDVIRSWHIATFHSTLIRENDVLEWVKTELVQGRSVHAYIGNLDVRISSGNGLPNLDCSSSAKEYHMGQLTTRILNQLQISQIKHK